MSIIFCVYYFKVILFVTQAILVGNLSQYFCEKNILEKEQSTLNNNSELTNLNKEEMQASTRSAYLYAAGIALISLIISINVAWTFIFSGILGMKHRILFIAAIYEKAKNIIFIHASMIQLCIYTHTYIIHYYVAYLIYIIMLSSSAWAGQRL